jgi:hypothetical protein
MQKNQSPARPPALPKLLVVEFTRHQIETLLAALTVAQDEFEIHVMAPAEVEKLIPSSLSIKAFHPIGGPERKFKFRNILQAFGILRRLNPDFVLLNDPQGNTVKWFSLLALLHPSRFVGIHQNPNKLVDGSLTQTLINLKMKSYFVLADYILDTIASRCAKTLRLETLYAVYSGAPLSPTPAEEPRQHQLRIAIHGFVETNRRDYFGLVKAVKNSPTPLSEKVHFLILGNSNSPDGQRLKAEIQSAGLSKHFTFYEGFIPQEELNRQTQSAHLVATLIHPNDMYFDLYRRYKITGAYLWSGTYFKPLWLHQIFATDHEFQDWAFFYDPAQMVESLNHLAGHPELISQMSARLMKSPRFELKSQKRKFSQFIKGTSNWAL